MNIINLIGIQSFLILFLFHNNFIPIIIYVNGVLCHSLVDTKFGNYIKIYDITTNTILLVYINYYTTWQYYTFIITIFSIFVFILKKYYYCEFLYSDRTRIQKWFSEVRSIQNQCIHVLGTHIPMCILLYKYIK